MQQEYPSATENTVANFDGEEPQDDYLAESIANPMKVSHLRDEEIIRQHNKPLSKTRLKNSVWAT